jgi:hypothetical protein
MMEISGSYELCVCSYVSKLNYRSNLTCREKVHIFEKECINMLRWSIK